MENDPKYVTSKKTKRDQTSTPDERQNAVKTIEPSWTSSTIKSLSTLEDRTTSPEAKVPQVVAFNFANRHAKRDDTSSSLDLDKFGGVVEQEVQLSNQKKTFLQNEDMLVELLKEDTSKEAMPKMSFSSSEESLQPTELKISIEYQLVNDLLSSYNKHIRPVKNPGDVTYVFVELSLFNVLKLVRYFALLKVLRIK